MNFRYRVALLFLSLLIAGSVHAQRDRIRLSNIGGTKVTDTQALELTLTMTPASRRSIQQIVRTAGELDKTGKTLTAVLNWPEAEFVQVGQRVRAFSLQARSSMYQAKITHVAGVPGHATVEATLSGVGLENSSRYVMEITIDRGEFLSIPNEAIIEEGDRRIVYVEKQKGQYTPVIIETGFQGELLTEVQKGLNDGDRVVTFGSFFIDSEYKLKISDQGPSK